MRSGDLGRIVLFLCLASIVRADVAGVVHDIDGKPVAGATLMLYSHKNEWGLDDEVVETVHSGQNGQYHFAAKLQFNERSRNRDNYYIITASHPDSAFGWTNIHARNQKPPFDIVLTRPMKQTVVVTDAHDRPIEGATIWIEQAGSKQDPQVSLRDPMRIPTNIKLVSAVTGQHGRATLDHLPDTEITVVATKSGFADQPKSLTKPDHKDAQITLAPAGVVRGTVRDDDGQAVADAVVWFTARSTKEKHFARTNSDGQYECNTLPAGAYDVSIEHPDYRSDTATIRVDPGQTIDAFDLTVTSSK